MFFYLSKIFWWFFNPGNVFLFLLVGTVFFLFLKWRKLSVFFGTALLVWIVAIGVLPTGGYLLHLLENRFPHNESLPDKVAGIVVLGGAINVRLSDERPSISINNNVERVTELLYLTKKYPDVPVLYSGGAGLLGYPDLNESIMIKPLLSKLVSENNELIYEDQSRNTYENGLYSKKIIEQYGGGRWILVTSARHMPRSVAVFRHQGIDIIPYAVDYYTLPNFEFSLNASPISGITGFRTPLHEWLGLLAYYLTDKTTEFFPAPK